MRITDLLQSEKVISKRQYEKMLTRGLETVMCKSDGWDFSTVENMKEADARQWLHITRLKRTYERAHGLKPLISVFVIHFVDHKDEKAPDWPDELQPYRGKANNILEAYFCNKFDLPCE